MASRKLVIVVPPWVVRLSGFSPMLPARMVMFVISSLRCSRPRDLPSDETRPRPSGGAGIDAKRRLDPHGPKWCGQALQRQHGSEAMGVAGANRTGLGDQSVRGAVTRRSGTERMRNTAFFSPSRQEPGKLRRGGAHRQLPARHLASGRRGGERDGNRRRSEGTEWHRVTARGRQVFQVP